MDINEMHVWFRQYAQQMGMQNVRAILPEQIDLLINTSISDTINELIQQHIGLTNDRVITDNSKVGQINAFRSLYTVIEVPVFGTYDVIDGDEETRYYSKPYFVIGDEQTNICKISTNFEDETDTISGVTKQYFPSYLFLVDLSINYKKGHLIDSYSVPEYTEGTKVTNYFPVRVIDDAFLADTLNDFILKPRLRSPIAVVYKVPNTQRDVKIDLDNPDKNLILDLYLDEFISDTDWSALKHGLLPYKLRMSFIKRPNKVAKLDDLTGEESTNVNCDLPESMHVDILKHAVDLYRVAVNGSLYASQQQEQQQQRENTRNNYRNEGQPQGYPRR